MSNYIGSSDEALDFLRSIHVRDRLILELTDALEIAEAALDAYSGGESSDLDAIRNALTKVRGAQA